MDARVVSEIQQLVTLISRAKSGSQLGAADRVRCARVLQVAKRTRKMGRSSSVAEFIQLASVLHLEGVQTSGTFSSPPPPQRHLVDADVKE